MGYWAKVTKQAWKETLEQIRLDRPVRVILTIGGPIAAGVATWIAIGGLAWGSLATVLLMGFVGGGQFASRLVSVPRDLASVQEAALLALTPTVVRDVGLTEAVVYAVTGKWGLSLLQIEGPDWFYHSPQWNNLLQNAFDGRITLWGRNGAGIYEQIPHDYWANYRIDWHSLVIGAPHTELVTYDPNPIAYNSLMACRAQFEALYQHVADRQDDAAT